MTNRITSVGWFLVAAVFALCWYPLKYLKGMQIGSPQLLFYAFASASLCTIPWLAYQAKEWRNQTESLLVFGITGSVMLTFLHFSIMGGEILGSISIFSLVVSSILLLKRVLSEQSIVFTEFLVLLVIAVASLLVFFGLRTTVIAWHWSQLSAVIAGLSCYLFYQKNGSNQSIPVASRLAAVFICSTWLVGMVIIFSPRFVSFPYENAVLISVLYGVLGLIPVLLAVLKVFSAPQEKNLLIWVALVLIVAVVSVEFLEVASGDTLPQ